MTISNILEHWATIYKDLSHNPESKKLEDQRFFQIRYIDLENTFKRNYNILHSPCMLQSVTSTGELKDAHHAVVSHQIWFLAKVKDSAQSLGRFDGQKLEQTANHLLEICEDFISYLLEVKRTGKCPISGTSYATDPQLLQELQSIDTDSVSYGVMPDLYEGQWMIGAVDWRSIRPLYKFACGKNGKYNTPSASNENENENSSE